MKSISTLLLFVISFTSIFGQKTENSSREHFCSKGKKNQTMEFKDIKKTLLMNKYDVKFYKLDINLERTSVAISGNVTIGAVVQGTPLDTFVFDLDDVLLIDSIKINNSLKTYTRLANQVYVPVLPTLTVGTAITAQIYYHGTPSSGGFFAGITHTTSGYWGNEVVFTLSEPYNAYQWWPCKQDLTDKADSAYIFVTTSNLNKVGSNGLLAASVPVAGSKIRYEWKTRYPIDYYLISVSVAKYIDYTTYAHPAGTTDSVRIQNYLYDNTHVPSVLGQYQTSIDQTADFIELYSDLFGMYPFKNEKYGHSMAPLGGGMEHQTMTTLGSFSFDLVCHELAHQWWGDHVTCGTWSDIWLNEGFATYSEYLAKQNLDPGTAQQWLTDVHTSVMSAVDGSVYIPAAQTNDVNRIFDSRLSYDKGGAIIHQMRFETQNDALFFQTLKNFQTQYAYSTALGLDFKSVLETTTGINFTDNFNQWYFGEGYPTYNIVWNQVADTVTFTATQTASMPSVTPLFKMLMEYKLNSASGDTLVKVYQTANVNTFKIHTHKIITGMVVDPNDWVINKVGTITVGIENVENPVYFCTAPNPVEDFIYVYLENNNSTIKEIRVLDITGRELLNQSTLEKNTKLDLSNLKSGFYMISITDGKNIYSKRIVKL
ncbi:MAG: T9SS type A sorting domain-containing protein [Bacteroidetes bacterium]|nr:T9SS type A sorting domain-containing protein [Bacteroidota bacterium]